MKVSVQQIMLFVAAADKLRRFVHTKIECVDVCDRNGAAWEGLLQVEQAAVTVQGMADAMSSAEVTMKG